MSVAEMQACLARLYTDDAYRRLFMIDPDGVLDDYRLSDDERAAVRKVDPAQLDFFAASLKSKRRKVVAFAYPSLLKLDGAAIERYYERYYQLYRRHPSTTMLEDTVHFGEFMEETLRSDPTLPAFAADLARYERLYAVTRSSPAVDGPGAAGVGTAVRPSTEDCPALSASVRLETFGHDVTAIDDALRQGLEPGSDEPGHYHVIFQRRPIGEEPKAFRISAGTKEVLDRCDGIRSLGEIAAALEAEFEQQPLTEHVLAIAGQLLGLGVLEMQPDDRADPAAG